MKVGLTLMENVLMPSAKIVLLAVEAKVATSATDVADKKRYDYTDNLKQEI